MKIFELNTFCGNGSTGRIAVEIAEQAAKDGYETIIGFGAGTPPADAECYALRIGGKIGRKWHGAIRKLLDAEGYGSAHATRELIAFIKNYKPDVIHLHNLHGCYLNLRILFRYLRKAGIPVIWTLHDCWAFTGHCAYFDWANCDRWKTQCFACPQKRSYPACIGIGGSKRNYMQKKKWFSGIPNLTIVTPCVWLKNLLPASYLASYPVRVLYNGVDRSVFFPAQRDIRADYHIECRYVVLAVASEWEQRKGITYLPALADALGSDYQLVVIGLTPTQIEQLPDNIIGICRTESRMELVAWYSTADCVVNPTMEDNMPLVNLEALACGTPVAAFATGGCPEAINDLCGAIVPKGDVPALSGAVMRLAPHKPELKDACLAQAARFDSTSCTKAYVQLYHEVAQ